MDVVITGKKRGKISGGKHHKKHGSATLTILHSQSGSVSSLKLLQKQPLQEFDSKFENPKPLVKKAKKVQKK